MCLRSVANHGDRALLKQQVLGQHQQSRPHERQGNTLFSGPRRAQNLGYFDMLGPTDTHSIYHRVLSICSTTLIVREQTETALTT